MTDPTRAPRAPAHAPDPEPLGGGGDGPPRPAARGAEPLPAVGPGARRLLDLVAHAERTTAEFAVRHGFASDYDVPFDYGRSGPRPATPLSRMTLDEVDAHQAQMRGGGSTAVGRYQFLRATLRELTARHGLSGGRRLDGPLQDALARTLLRRRRYDAHGAGEATADETMDALAAEWASLPMVDGLSRYAFRGKRQPVRVTRAELAAVLAEARRLDFGR